jgi:glycosyltransferase involved in cell wall biosynthesis
LTKHKDRLVRIPREDTTGLVATFPPYWSIPKAQFLHAGAVVASSYLHMKKVYEEFRFDVIVGMWAYPDCVAAVQFGRIFNVPVVSAVLGSDVTEVAGWKTLSRQITWALKESKRVIAVSGALADRVESLGVPRERIVVRRNGVNGEQFHLGDAAAAREQLGVVLNGKKHLVYVGNVKHEKGTDVLMEAMRELTSELGVRDVVLSIVGSGDLEAKVKQRASELKLEPYVAFRGRRLYDEIPVWMRSADVFVLPSRREGCPNVILEALASGRPVVASHVGGIPELINEKNGYLVEATNASALARSLRDALARDWNAEDLRNTVEALSWNDVGDTYRDVLTEVVRGR